MPQVPSQSVENNFTAGLKTEFTGLNFPENASTDSDNVIYTLIGDVLRRAGFDLEANAVLNSMSSTSGSAVTTYRWLNVGGDGSTQILVAQIGKILHFFRSSVANNSSPISATLLGSTIDISTYQIGGDPTGVECRYADGNGYLFVFNSNCDPFFITYNAGVLTATKITVQIRDFIGIPEPGVAFNFRPSTLSAEHQYNLQNQGWGSSWTASSSTSNSIGTGTFIWTLNSDTLPITVGDTVVAYGYSGGFGIGSITGTVVSYIGFVLNITETSNTGSGTSINWNIKPSPNYINIFFNKAKIGGGDDTGAAQLLNKYPSNSEQWWTYRDTNVTRATPDGSFTPSRTTNYVVLNNNQAPQGSIILEAFNQQRSKVSGILGLATIITNKRPQVGCWHAGRVWYSGIDDSQQATGDAPYYTWTENIYFSQISAQNTDFGHCFQVNDPSSDRLFDILPTDGGVITIQGSGPIYELFSVQNGLLVRAANGIWFITGSQGVGFAANDYSINKISAIESINNVPSVSVQGWPMFWNAEGIYSVHPQEGAADHFGASIAVQPITLGTILSFYNTIPLSSKILARGAYDPTSYLVQWMYRSTNATTILERTSFDRVLIYNVANKTFYTYSLPSTGPTIHAINFVQSPGGVNISDPTFKYFTFVSGSNWSFAEERDTNYVDWASVSSVGYTSYFITGYKLHGKAVTRFQNPYLFLYSNINSYQYLVQGIWNYAIAGNSGKFTQTQLISQNDSNFDKLYRRVKIRGRGPVLQFKVTSITGQPFDLMGWSLYETIGQGI